MSYGSVGFEAVTAIIKILFMVLGFLMPLASILTWLEREKQKPVAKEELAKLAPNFKDRGASAYVMLANILLNLDEALTKE